MTKLETHTYNSLLRTKHPFSSIKYMHVKYVNKYGYVLSIYAKCIRHQLFLTSYSYNR